ncbi:MAG: small multi-drug export protein [Candidatus Thermoplasmatota archaeon]
MTTPSNDIADLKKTKSDLQQTKKISGWFQLAIFFFIIAAGAIFVVLVYLLLTPAQQQWYAALSVAYFIPPAGKETVIFIGLSQGLPVLPWCSTLWVFDVLVCLAIMTNWWFFEVIITHIPPFPFLGIRREKPHCYKKTISLKIWYEKLHQKTRQIEMKHYGKLMLFVLALFMFVPFQGTGAMSTTIIGTFLGLRQRTTFFIVAAASFLSILGMSLLSIGIIQL